MSFNTLTAFSSFSSASLTGLLHFVIWKTMMSLEALTAIVIVLQFMQAVMLFVQVEALTRNFQGGGLFFFFNFFLFIIFPYCGGMAPQRLSEMKPCQGPLRPTTTLKIWDNK